MSCFCSNMICSFSISTVIAIDMVQCRDKYNFISKKSEISLNIEIYGCSE